MRRSTLKRPARLAALAVVGIAGYGCQDGPEPVAPADWQTDFPIAATVINELEVPQFLWLSPLLDGKPDTPLATGLAIDVEICNVSDGTPCSLERASEEGSFYGAHWDTSKGEDANKEFRITAYMGDSRIPLGQMKVILDGGSERDGRTFPIRFFAGSGLLSGQGAALRECVGSDRCDATGVPSGNGGPPVVIQAKQSDGSVLGQLTIDPAIVPEPLIVMLDCRRRLTGFAAGEGPLPTDLSQYPVFCHVDALKEDGTSFSGSLSGNARIDVCTIDETYVDEAYHPQLETRLGKSSGPGNFEILAAVPSTLTDCTGVTVLAAAEPGLLDALGSRFASLVGAVLPQKLYASMFRDGGAGGLLSSFSDINIVEPAFISGSVTGAGFGLSGVTVQLSGGGLPSPLSATTNGSGQYAFTTPLNAADGGGTTYTVTVTGGSILPAQVADPDQDVVVTGSGVYTADFAASGVLFGGASLAGGSGTVFDWSTDGTSGTSAAPFATPGYPYCGVLGDIVAAPVGTDDVWPLNTTITLTKQFYVPTGVSSLTLTGWVDNDAKVSIYDANQTETNITGSPVDGDGWKVHENCADTNPLVFTAASGTFTPGALNTLVIQVRDRGTVGYADFELTAN